jgi:hypothetical protein
MVLTMLNTWAVAIVVIVLLVAAFPYVQHTKHTRARPFAAYLLFIAIFALVTAVLYALIGGIVTALGFGGALDTPLAALLFVAAIFVPAFLIARWQVRRPPHRPMMPP